MQVKLSDGLWPAWIRFLLMLVLILAIDTAWLGLVPNLHFIVAPANPGKNLAATMAAAQANVFIGCLLGIAVNAGLVAWALWQRHLGEAMAAVIGMLWIAGGGFCLYLLMLFGYSIVAALNSVQQAGH